MVLKEVVIGLEGREIHLIISFYFFQGYAICFFGVFFYRLSVFVISGFQGFLLLLLLLLFLSSEFNSKQSAQNSSLWHKL